VSRLVFVLLLAGCANGASSLPLATNATVPQGLPRQLVHNDAGKARTYQYVTAQNEALRFDYPKGTQSNGTISGLNGPQGECSSGSGTFWIVNTGGDDIAQYTYDGKRLLRTLSENAGTPFECAVDSRNGDIAVTAETTGGKGTVVVFKGGKQGDQTTYDFNHPPYFVGYDDKGNLFADNLASAYSASLWELVASGESFEKVAVPNTIHFPGSVQWDGKYVAVTDQTTNAIYRYTISNYGAALKGTATLNGAGDCAATWIAEPYVYCADAGNNAVEIYKYPAGGDSVGTLGNSNLDLPLGVVQVTK
jgi:hypothetical protein